MAERQEKLHAIMICVPYQGHINPFVNLALKLASMGFSITFVHLEFIHHKLSQAHHGQSRRDFFYEARQSGLDIRYTTISDGFPLEYDRDVNIFEYWDIILRDFPALVDQFVGKIIESDQDNCLNFLVTDTVFNWPAAISDKYKLVNVSLWTEPALVFALLYHLDLLAEKGHFPFNDNIVENVDYIPGVESISTKDLMSYLAEPPTSVTMRVLSMGFDSVKKADFILHNTIHELESQTLSALNRYHLYYAIGPINFSKNLATISKSLWSESDCTQWLDSKPPGSVLYVSFGSLVQTSREVIEELAYGLLLSEVNFIWVVRDGLTGFFQTNELPDGYEDEVKGRGLIIPWCDQIRVLSSPAVGGFLTHCGWNSTMESMWCGVPMICYPIMYDQPTNRKLVVDDWKIGVNLCDGKEVDRKQVCEKINNFMSGSEVKRLKEEVGKVKKILHDAMDANGSSERNFQRFVDRLKAKIHETARNVDT